MANDFYTHGTVPQNNSRVRSYPIRNEFDQITFGFNKFPALTVANANKALVISAIGNSVGLTDGTLQLDGNLTTTGAFNTTFVQNFLSSQQSFQLPATSFQATTDTEYKKISGLTLGNRGVGLADDVNDILVTRGQCTIHNEDMTEFKFVTTPDDITKRIDAVWEEGDDEGGMAPGVTLLSSASYAVFLIMTEFGTLDVAFDNTATGANIFANPMGVFGDRVTMLRRIGVIKRFSNVNVPFYQKGNYFLKNTNLGSSFNRSNALEFGFNDARVPTGTDSIADLPLIILLKVRIHNDAPPGGTNYFRIRYGQSNDAASEVNCHAVYGNGDIRGNTSLVMLPWIKGLYPSDGHGFRFFAGSATTMYDVDYIGFIDFRE